MRGSVFYTDIAVLGGGAAGLCAAINAARTFKEKNKPFTVTVVEKNPRVGKKLLLTGNGRCNISNEKVKLRDMDSYYGDRIFAGKVFSRFKGCEEFFSSLGILLTRDDEGRLYPRNRTSASVLDGLRLETAKLGVTELTGFDCVNITPLMEGYKLSCGNTETGSIYNEIKTRRLLVTAGGLSAPQTGSDGNILALLEKMGIKTVKPFPSLCHIKIHEKNLSGLKGIRVKACCKAQLGGKVIKSETGEVQFGEYYISGICVMNVSRLAGLYGEKLTLSLDLLPEIPKESLYGILSRFIEIRGGAPLEDFLTGILPKRVSIILLKEITPKAMNEKSEGLSTKELQNLAGLIKNWTFPVKAPELSQKSWQDSQVTAGGISASEINADTMEIKNFPGLFIAGEIINVDGDCGGYNLAWAWASGEAAGRAAAESL